jgi:hypothetical protein
MSLLMPRLLYVSASDQTASFSAISAALLQAVSGDTVLVAPGRYSPSLTGERFPLYVPPGVTLMGAGQGETTIEGDGAMELSFRPVCEGQSLVLLGNGSTLSGCSVLDGGGHGVSNQPGARVLITRNEIRGHGQHGILISGVQEAVIKDNIFLDNGTKRFAPLTPRGARGRQGHHIFVQGRAGVENRVMVMDNTMTRTFADGIAVVVWCDEPDGVVVHASIINNLIEQSERRGVTIVGSLSSSYARTVVEMQRNVMRDNTDCAIVAQATHPLLPRLSIENRLQLQVIDNECRSSLDGIALCGGFGPAHDNMLDATIMGNAITGMTRHPLRVIGGVGYRGHAAHNNQVRVLVHRNWIEDGSGVPVFIQGGATEASQEATGNAVLACITDNQLPNVPGQPSIVIDDGPPGNAVQLDEPAQAYERRHVAVGYYA